MPNERDPLASHLHRALDSTDDESTRYHLRQALQLRMVEDRNLER